MPQQERRVQRPRLLLDRPAGEAMAESVGVPVPTRVEAAGATRSLRERRAVSVAEDVSAPATDSTSQRYGDGPVIGTVTRKLR